MGGEEKIKKESRPEGPSIPASVSRCAMKHQLEPYPSLLIKRQAFQVSMKNLKGAGASMNLLKEGGVQWRDILTLSFWNPKSKLDMSGSNPA